MAKLGAKLFLLPSTDDYKLPKIIALSGESTVTLGRSYKMCDVVLDVASIKSISRRHAEIVCEKGRRGPKTYTLRDLGSTNGVFVNEFKVQEQILKHGDVVQFGGAADISVGTRFSGTGSQIRYRFEHELAVPAIQKSCSTSNEPAAQRTKIQRTDTLDAAETLFAISNGSLVTTAGASDRAGATEAGGAAGGNSAQRAFGDVGVANGGGAGPSAVVEVLRDAMCGLCSELLLDARVLPCSHSFCRLCWADHVQEKGTTCPVCMRKMHSSERNPRQCSNLDLLITSIVHKLAGSEERERWAARQLQAQKRATAAEATARPGSNGAAVAGAQKAAPVPTAAASIPRSAAESNRSPARGNHVPDKHSGVRQERTEGWVIVKGEPGRRISVFNGGCSDSSSGGGTAARAKTVICDGCNEEGHEFRECPHRSDSALEQSEDEDEDEDEEYKESHLEKEEDGDSGDA